MSMDEQHNEMRNFTESLTNFNSRLKASMHNLAQMHEEMRIKYDSTWQPFKEQMNHYITVESRNYVEFLHIKIYAIRRYLYGE